MFGWQICWGAIWETLKGCLCVLWAGGQSLVTNRKQKWHVFLTSCQSVYRWLMMSISTAGDVILSLSFMDIFTEVSGVVINSALKPGTVNCHLIWARSHADFDGSRHHHLAFVLVSAWRLVLARLLSGRQWVREDAAFEWRWTQAGSSRRGRRLRVSVGGARWRGGWGGRAASSAHSRAWPLPPLGSIRSSAPELTDQLVLDETEDVLDAAAFFGLCS